MLALFVGGSAGMVADAQPQAVHDKAYYVANPDVRQSTLKVCYSDESYAHLFDCRNAADAETFVWGQRMSAQSNFLADPTWWQQNPIARRGAAVTCRRGTGPAYQHTAPYCPLILAASLQAQD